MLDPWTGVCYVLEDRYYVVVYERMKANEGQPLHVWRVEFTARNGSERLGDRSRASNRHYCEPHYGYRTDVRLLRIAP